MTSGVHLAILLITGLSVFHLVNSIGVAPGFAKGTVGGGNLKPVIPKDKKDLERLLKDSQPQVILLDRPFDFRGDDGEQTETGCSRETTECPKGFQYGRKTDNWCDGKKTATFKYNKASITPLAVSSRKTLLGKETSGLLIGKGLRIANNATDIIIQNIHIKELNPSVVWGGDAITLAGSDKIWIDHCTFSNIGRQMIVTGFAKAGRVAITNCLFDGKTAYSNTCNGQHYWTMLFLGSSDSITLQNNYIREISGRGPKVGGSGANVVLHAVNNYWLDVKGHALDDHGGAYVLLEGNYFEKVHYPRFTDPKGQVYAPTTSNSDCQALLGRACQPNVVAGDTKLKLTGDKKDVFQKLKGNDVGKVASASQAKEWVKSNAGIGKIN